MSYIDPEHKRAKLLKENTDSKKPKKGRPPTEDKRIFVTLRLRTSFVGRLQRIYDEAIAEGRSPWRSKSQQMEALMLAGLETLRDNDTVEEALQYLRAVKENDVLGDRRKEAQAALSRVKTEISELLAIKARKEAQVHFWKMIRRFEEMDESVWRNWFLVMLREAFPKLATKAVEHFVSLDIEDEMTPERLSKLKVEKKDK